jgi:hypothetical protein
MTTNTEQLPSLIEFNNLFGVLYRSLSDFESQLSTYDPLRQNNSAIINDLKKKDYLFRINLLSEYYGISLEEIEELIKLPKSERTQACSEKGVNRFFLRTLFDYNRYAGCYLLHNFLSQRFQFKNKNILDFGCLVSDYGFYFGMLNMKVTLCDVKEHVDFADFRLSRANINTVKFFAPANYKDVTKDQDIAIFGEVLEHLKDPYLLLESCVENKVSYIFSTSYPYGDEHYFNLPGHTKEAKEQAPKCIELLRKNYVEFYLMRRSNVWVNKEEFMRDLCVP